MFGRKDDANKLKRSRNSRLANSREDALQKKQILAAAAAIISEGKFSVPIIAIQTTHTTSSLSPLPTQLQELDDHHFRLQILAAAAAIIPEEKSSVPIIAMPTPLQKKDGGHPSRLPDNSLMSPNDFFDIIFRKYKIFKIFWYQFFPNRIKNKISVIFSIFFLEEYFFA